MNPKLVTCEKCGHHVTYTLKPRTLTREFKLIHYEFEGRVATCDHCGSLIETGEAQQYNDRAFDAVFRKKNGIIPLEYILELPRKYAIGKRPLSLIMGWGVQTFSRYAEGYMPKKKYSDQLYRIYSDPCFFAELLQANKKFLDSDLAYRKSRKAVEEILSREQITDRRIDIVAQYILQQCWDITPLSVQMLLYYIQGFSLAFTDRDFFNEDCSIWANSLIFRDIYFRYMNYRFNPSDRLQSASLECLSPDAIKIVDRVIQYFSCFSGMTLRQFITHEAPWINTCDNTNSHQIDRIIPKKEITEYFKSLRRTYNMNSVDDIGLYAKFLYSLRLC